MDKAAAAVPSEVVEYTHKAKISSGGGRRTVLDVFKVMFGTSLFIREGKSTAGVTGAAVSSVFSACQHVTVPREITKLHDIGNLTSWNCHIFKGRVT